MKFPNKCPYCGKDIIPKITNKDYELGKVDPLKIEIHRCIHCHKPIFAVRQSHLSGGTYIDGSYVYIYPVSTSVSLPKRVELLSPNACNAFTQALQAHSHGFDMLVGAGLRISLEWLVWDYLVKVKQLPESELKSLKLVKRIEMLDGSFYVSVCAKLIRLFGNDSVHITKMLDFSVDEAIEAFKMLCSLIDSELNIIETNNRLES